MKSKMITLAVVVAIIGALTIVNRMEPNRSADELLRDQVEAAQEIAKAEEAAEKAKATDAKKEEQVVQAKESSEEKVEMSMDPFRVKFELSTGDVVLEIYPEWSPLGAAQFKNALEMGVYDDARFFRALENFMVQFGIPGNPELAKYWANKNIMDEPVKTTNARGTVTFAKTQMPNTRSSQLFINTVNNARLDGMGFAPFGKVIEGMENVDKIYTGYGQTPDQGRIERIGNAYLKENFPKLDYIKKATILD